MNGENTANIPVLGLSSCGHSVIALLSASILISMEFPPTNTHSAMDIQTNAVSILKWHSLEYIPLPRNMFQFAMLNWYTILKSVTSLKYRAAAVND